MSESISGHMTAGSGAFDMDIVVAGSFDTTLETSWNLSATSGLSVTVDDYIIVDSGAGYSDPAVVDDAFAACGAEFSSVDEGFATTGLSDGSSGAFLAELDFAMTAIE